MDTREVLAMLKEKLRSRAANRPEDDDMELSCIAFVDALERANIPIEIESIDVTESFVIAGADLKAILDYADRMENELCTMRAIEDLEIAIHEVKEIEEELRSIYDEFVGWVTR